MGCNQKDALLVRGASSTGKTAALAARACELAAAGEDVLVIAACPGGLREMGKRLSAFADGGSVRLVSAERLASDLLREPEVAAHLGHPARLMMPFEQKMLFEDLKTSGIKPKRLREMTGFFERTYSDLGERADDFPFEWEETGMLSYEEGYLSLYKVATLERASCAICRCLEEDGSFAARVGAQHVLVDDYRLLGRAMQRACCALAKREIVVSWDDAPATPVRFRFPCETGDAEFLEAFPNARVVDLGASHASRGVCGALDAIRADEVMGLESLTRALGEGSQAGAGERRAYATPAAELEGIVGIFKEAHDRGVAWGDMAISGVSGLWLANAALALRRAGVPVSVVPDDDAVPIGFENEKRNDAARLASMIALAANPDDDMAWRVWCGFGSYTGNSAVFMRIREAAKADGCGVRAVLEGIRTGKYPKIGAIADSANVVTALDEALFALKKFEGARGDELLHLAATLSQVNDGKPASGIMRLISCADGWHGLSGDEDASALATLLAHAAAESTRSTDDAVLACAPEGMAGEKFRVVVFCGAVNGIVPKAKYFDAAQLEEDKRDRVRLKDEARLYAALSCATESVHVTSFTDIGLEQAERLKLEMDRIRAERGMRIATVSPSVFVLGIPDAGRAGDGR